MGFGYISRVPWHLVRGVLATYRVVRHTVPKPEHGPRLIVTGVDYANADPERVLTAILGRRYFDPNWELSVNYAGELLNLRRVEFAPEEGPPDVEWWQVHLRAFEHPDGLELLAHYEPEPSESPEAHLSEEYMDVERGTAMLAEVLTDAGVEFTRVD